MIRKLFEGIDEETARHVIRDLPIGRRNTLVQSAVDQAFIDCTPERKVNCMKAVRSLTGLGIKESKEIVEKYEETTRTVVDVTLMVKRLKDLVANRQCYIPVDLAQDIVADYTSQITSINLEALKRYVSNQLFSQIVYSNEVFEVFDDDSPL